MVEIAGSNRDPLRAKQVLSQLRLIPHLSSNVIAKAYNNKHN